MGTFSSNSDSLRTSSVQGVNAARNELYSVLLVSTTVDNAVMNRKFWRGGVLGMSAGQNGGEV